MGYGYPLEETTETLTRLKESPADKIFVAAKGGDRSETVYEIADLAYHVMLLMCEMGISMDEIRAELASRHVVDHKVKQETSKSTVTVNK